MVLIQISDFFMKEWEQRETKGLNETSLQKVMRSIFLFVAKVLQNYVQDNEYLSMNMLSIVQNNVIVIS